MNKDIMKGLEGMITEIEGFRVKERGRILWKVIVYRQGLPEACNSLGIYRTYEEAQLISQYHFGF